MRPSLSSTLGFHICTGRFTNMLEARSFQHGMHLRLIYVSVAWSVFSTVHVCRSLRRTVLATLRRLLSVKEFSS